MPRINQTSFSRGEISEELMGRIDTEAYFNAVRGAENMVVSQYGGIMNRPGMQYIAACKNHDKKTRLIPFVFGNTDTHILEFGENYIRVFREDGQVLETAATVSNATQANPVVIETVSAHGYSTGDEVFLSGVSGMTELNNRNFKITVISTTEFSLQDQITGNDIDGTGFTAHSGGGSSSRVYEIPTDYMEDELFEIKLIQSFDVITLVHPNHPVKELSRLAVDNWSLEDVAFTPDQGFPENVSATANSTGSTTVRYAVSATSDITGEEGLIGLAGIGATVNISNITKANPAEVETSSNHGFNTGHEVFIENVGGMTELNDRRFKIVVTANDKFQLSGVNSSNFTAYTSGGTATPAFAEITNSKGTNDLDNTISWDPVTDTNLYAVYREENGLFAFLGETTNTEYDDIADITPDTTDAAPASRNPFLGAGNYPNAVGSHEQRRMYGGSDNAPERIVYSQTAGSKNFTQASPLRPDDSFTATVPVRKANQVRHFVSIGDLLVFTNAAVVRVTSGDRRFSFDTIQVKTQEAVGASNLAPIIVGDSVIFEEENGERVHSARFSFTADRFVLTNLTLFSPHLLRTAKLVDWDFKPWPQPIIVSAKDDGGALCLTYNPEDQSQVTGWTRWKTSGSFRSVAAIRSAPKDKEVSLYFVVQRKIDGSTVNYIEKLVSRQFEDVRDARFVDSFLTLDNPIAVDSVTSASPLVVTTKDPHGLENGDRVDVSGIVWETSFDEVFNEVQPGHLNGNRYIVRNKTSTTFQLEVPNSGDIVDGSDFPDYVRGGSVRKVVTNLSGYRHLRNQTVVGLVDGNVVRNIEVNENGEITLPRGASRVHIGLPYISNLEFLPIESKSGGLTGRRTTQTDLVLRLYKTRGFFVGPSTDPDELSEWAQREFENYGEPTQFLTGDAEFTPYQEWKLGSDMYLRQKDPLPFSLLLYSADVDVEQLDRRP